MIPTSKYKMYIVAAFTFAVAATVAVMLPFCRQTTRSDETAFNIEALNDSIWYIKANFTKALDVEGIRIADLYMESDSGKVSLHAFIAKPMLIFRYFDNNCSPCIRTENKLIKEYAGDISDRILFIGSFQSYHALQAYNRANEINFTSLLVAPDQQLSWEPDTHRGPYYFVLYPNGKASHFFMSVPEYTSYTKIYLEGINRLLTEKNKKLQ